MLQVAAQYLVDKWDNLCPDHVNIYYTACLDDHEQFSGHMKCLVEGPLK